MNQEKLLFSEAIHELYSRKEITDSSEYDLLILEAEALLHKCTHNEVVMDTGDESLSELYFIIAELLFYNDLAVKTATHAKSFANEAKALEYYNKAIEIQDKEEYFYELWNFLCTAGHKDEGITALENFIERTGGTAKVLSTAAEEILMYADSEDTKTIQKSLDYFYAAIEKEPDRYDTYLSYWTDLREAVDVCPQLFKEAILCINRMIKLSLPKKSENHDTLGIRYFDLGTIYIKMEEYEKALGYVKKGFAICGHSDYGIGLMIKILNNRIKYLREEKKSDKELAKTFFDLAHCYHIMKNPILAARYYLSIDNVSDIVSGKYMNEYLLYKEQESFWMKYIKHGKED